MVTWWQHLPEHIDPIAFQVGFFSIRWYALCWLAGFTSVLGFALFAKGSHQGMKRLEILDLYLVLFIGALLGGHIGFALLYEPALFFGQPSLLFSPIDANGAWVGLSGMSFHGGLWGVIVALWYFAKTRKMKMLILADHIVMVVPLALFFGRIGNFLNGELPGRITSVPWGVYFPFDVSTLRHPSTLYEAILEGILLFCLLSFSKKRVGHGELSALFLVFYGALRFLVEFLREPDQGLPLMLSCFTRGQFFSALMLLSGGVLFIWFRQKNHGKLEG